MSTDCSAEFTESLNNRVSNKTLITLPRRYRDHPDDFPVAARPVLFFLYYSDSPSVTFFNLFKNDASHSLSIYSYT